MLGWVALCLSMQSAIFEMQVYSDVIKNTALTVSFVFGHAKYGPKLLSSRYTSANNMVAISTQILALDTILEGLEMDLRKEYQRRVIEI